MCNSEYRVVHPGPPANYSDPTAYYQAWSQYYAQMGYAMPDRPAYGTGEAIFSNLFKEIWQP